MRKPALAASISPVAAQPTASMGRGTVSRPMTRPLSATSVMTAVTGAASTPFATRPSCSIPVSAGMFTAWAAQLDAAAV